MIAHAATASREMVIGAQLGKLADCDASLSVIASDVKGLVDELALLRAGTDHLVERHAAQEALLAEKELTLSRLESERSQASLLADEISLALSDAETRLSKHLETITSLEVELHRLRGTLGDRDRRLVDVERELNRMREALAEREAMLRRDRADLVGLQADAERGSSRPAPPVEHAAVALPVEANARARPFEQQKRSAGARASVTGHLRFGAFPEGYRLTASEEPCSRPGDVVDVDGRRFLVSRIGRSPLPHDERPCAFLLPDGTRE